MYLLGWKEGEEDKIKIHENNPQRDWISEQQATSKDEDTETDEWCQLKKRFEIKQ